MRLFKKVAEDFGCQDLRQLKFHLDEDLWQQENEHEAWLLRTLSSLRGFHLRQAGRMEINSWLAHLDAGTRFAYETVLGIQKKGIVGFENSVDLDSFEILSLQVSLLSKHCWCRGHYLRAGLHHLARGLVGIPYPWVQAWLDGCPADWALCIKSDHVRLSSNPAGKKRADHVRKLFERLCHEPNPL
jgi:hypothetical protein